VLGLQGRNPPAEKARAASRRGRILESRGWIRFATSDELKSQELILC
jgi:hypothetical protein